jgi:hypothetical protein
VTVRIIEYANNQKVYIQGADDDPSYITVVQSTLKEVRDTTARVIFKPEETIKLIREGIQGPPGPAANAGWTYIQESTPSGSDSETWYQPSTGYGRIYLSVYGGWKRMILENMIEDNIDHSLNANGGYY